MRIAWNSALLVLSVITTTAGEKLRDARVLIYSATQRFRHDSIPTAIQALKEKGPASQIQFDNTEDQTQFTDSNLSQYDALVFLSTTGEVLDSSGIQAFQNYLDAGGNFIGLHAASDSLVNTTFYGREIGAYFDYHPPLTNATVMVLDASHPSTSMLPSRWQVQDEMYNFKSDPRSVRAVVLLSPDESTYSDPGPRKFDQGTPHPTAWYQEHGAGTNHSTAAGRSFYTSLGHLNETWQDSTFQAHVMGGIQWALQSNTTRAFNASGLVGNGPVSASASTPSSSGSSTGSPAARASSLASRNFPIPLSRWPAAPERSTGLIVLVAYALGSIW